MTISVAKKTKPVDLLSFVAALQKRHEAATKIESRKIKGQVFTPESVCRYMASLFTRIPDRVRLLDPGAGLGSLTAAFCERVLTITTPRVVEVTLYETDQSLLPLLEENLSHCRRALRSAGHELRYSIHVEDFILNSRAKREQRMLFDDDADEVFDTVIMNPPYFKTGADSAQAQAMAEVFQGQSNIYMMFMARASELLRTNGEMVAITPRSYCNGLYFKHFRRWFFSRMSLRHVHLFESRRSTFDDVLQESLITHTQRKGTPGSMTSITTSHGKEIPTNPGVLMLPTDSVLDDSCGDMVLRIPHSAQDTGILEAVESWPDRFAQTGLCISTGPVVLFRAREFLLDTLYGDDTVPLLEPHNVKAFQTTWPVEKRGKPTAFRVSQESMKHLVPARNYVLLRRFSAKEERRRLTASYFIGSTANRPYLALENHLNYVYHATRELTVEEVHGLTALFNSSLLDRYFRVISGNTQVNATEIRTMPFPTLDRLAAIGARMLGPGGFDPSKINSMVLEELGISGRVVDSLTGS